MLKTFIARCRQGHRTIGYPKAPAVLPDRFRGFPRLSPAGCADCMACLCVCPTQAIAKEQGSISIDLGKCLFCPACSEACPRQSILFSSDRRLAAAGSDGLKVSAGATPERVFEVRQEIRKLFGRSLKLRQVSAGGCNGCEVDVNVLGTIVFDLGRFGIQFVASPRHADGLLVTGPVTKNMREALEKTYAAVGAPKLVIASGTCAISGGVFRGSPEVENGLQDILPVDLCIPGCPPHPLTVLDGLLRLIGRLGAHTHRACR